MSENSKIEWTDHTFNPWEGCQKVGPGCDHCYAETRNARFGGGQAVNWGPGAPRRRTSKANWNMPLRWNAQHDAFFAKHGRRQRVFCAPLADVFDNAVDAQWRADLFTLILCTPNLDWLLLTKRIGNVSAMLPPTVNRFSAIFPNVWIGATIVNQEEADRDIPKLLAVPAHKRFLSMEPLLAAVELPRLCDAGSVPGPGGAGGVMCTKCNGTQHYGCLGIDWVIVGGESGTGARPMHPDWARSLRDQCNTAGVPFFLKQWGEWAPAESISDDNDRSLPERWLRRDGSQVRDGWVDFFGGDEVLYRVGKKKAGRLLDGAEHNEVPS